MAGDSDAANAAHDDLISVFRELKSSGLLHRLEPLLEDPDEDVRCWAATHYLLVDEQKGIKILRALSKGTSITAFNAEMALNEWQEGRLKFPS